MPIVIREVVSELVVGGEPEQRPGRGAGGEHNEALVDEVVRRAAERVIELLRREWEA